MKLSHTNIFIRIRMISYLQKKTISLNPHNYIYFNRGRNNWINFIIKYFINMFNEYINDKNRVLKILSFTLYIKSIY